MSKKLTTIILITFFLLPTMVNAVGVTVSPSKLLIETNANQLEKAALIIKNPSDIVSIYDVYPDDFPELIKLSPQSFTLEAGDSREVNLQLKIPQAGSLATQISVVAKPISARAFGANSGVKIPLEIRVAPVARQLTWVLIPGLTITNIIFFLDIILILIFLGLFIRKKLTKN